MLVCVRQFFRAYTHTHTHIHTNTHTPTCVYTHRCIRIYMVRTPAQRMTCDIFTRWQAAEIARKNAEAEAKFKQKFGNVKPSAGALLHRQRQHETR